MHPENDGPGRRYDRGALTESVDEGPSLSSVAPLRRRRDAARRLAILDSRRADPWTYDDHTDIGDDAQRHLRPLGLWTPELITGPAAPAQRIVYEPELRKIARSLVRDHGLPVRAVATLLGLEPRRTR